MGLKSTIRARAELAVGACVAVLLGSCLAPAPTAHAAPVAALNSTVTITTAGWGHGRGMSQYGAWGAAKEGLAYDQILAFYYPGTNLETKLATSLRVWLTDDATTNVKPETGLRVKDAAGKTLTLPRGANYTQWRITRTSNKQALSYRNAKGVWKTYKTKLNVKKTWQFVNPTTHTVTVLLPSETRVYRGSVSHVLSGNSAITVNNVSLEDYLKSVVPSEMPASWAPEALKAQTVAARSYALRYQANLGASKNYDICDTTACQVYKGTSKEDPATNAAVAATAGKVLTYGNTIAWTEFSSSNGGFSTKGSYPYQVAKADPYDASMRRYWALPFTSETIQAKYPVIGSFVSITVNSRDGNGLWGGRATSVTIKGSAASVTVSGTSFKATMGLRETLMIITSGLATDTANYQRWQQLGGSAGEKLGPPAGDETTSADGLVAPFANGTLFWSSTTGSRLLSGAVLQAYTAVGGPSGDLGFPTSDIQSGAKASFENGQISCPAGAKDARQCTVTLDSSASPDLPDDAGVDRVQVADRLPDQHLADAGEGGSARDEVDVQVEDLLAGDGAGAGQDVQPVRA